MHRSSRPQIPNLTKPQPKTLHQDWVPGFGLPAADLENEYLDIAIFCYCSCRSLYHQFCITVVAFAFMIVGMSSAKVGPRLRV